MNKKKPHPVTNERRRRVCLCSGYLYALNILLEFRVELGGHWRDMYVFQHCYKSQYRYKYSLEQVDLQKVF